MDAGLMDDAPQIVLIHPDSFHNLDYSHFNQGLLYIATCLDRAGYRVKCLDTSILFFLPPHDLAAYVLNLGVKIVGFYTISDNMPLVGPLAARLKRGNPSLVVVAGGPLATVEGAAMLQWPGIDVVVKGEGEEVMQALAAHFIHGEGKLEEIPGIACRRRKRIIETPAPSLIADLDALPFPDHSLLGKPPATLHLVTGRGCPYNCIFCFQEVHGRRYRARSAASVLAEIEAGLERYPGLTAIDILDDTFIADPKRVEEICRGLIAIRRRRGRPLILYCEGRVNVLARHPDLLDHLREAGLVRLQIGIESGDPEMLQKYEKGIVPEQVEAVVASCVERGIPSVAGNFILGGPGETEESIGRSLNFALHLLEMGVGVFECTNAFLCPFPGTQVAADPESMGLSVVDDHFLKGLTLQDVHLETRALSRDRLRALQIGFDAAVSRAMRHLAPKVPRHLVKAHFLLAQSYRMHTAWYLNAYARQDAIQCFMHLTRSPRFTDLAGLPLETRPEWRPMRTIEKRRYTPDGSALLLQGFFGRHKLIRPQEIRIYEWCSGKLTWAEVAQRVRDEFLPGAGLEEVESRWMMPLFRKLDRWYQVVFYR